MASGRDATDRFREAVRSAAANAGFDSERMAKVSSSLIIHKTATPSTFTRTAVEILGNIRAMHEFVLKHGKDYVDRFRTTEKERDNIEHEVGLFVKACRESIDALKDSINVEQKKATKSGGWLGGVLNNGPQNKDLNAHQHGMVLILSEHLHAVTAQFDQLRAGRFQEAIEKRVPKRRPGLQLLNNSISESQDAADPSNSLHEKEAFRHGSDFASQAQQQLFDDETRTLQIELTSMMDAVQETESKMLEVSALNHLFSTHVLKQAQQIEVLYQQALDATQNVEKGNKELTKAISRSRSDRLWIILVVFVLTFSLLFLDWYE